MNIFRRVQKSQSEHFEAITSLLNTDITGDLRASRSSSAALYGVPDYNDLDEGIGTPNTVEVDEEEPAKGYWSTAYANFVEFIQVHPTPYTLNTLYTTHYTLHTIHYTLHTTHYTLHTTHYVPPPPLHPTAPPPLPRTA